MFISMFLIKNHQQGPTIHQSKCWYYLGPLQTLKAELFAKIVFGYKPLTFSVKTFSLDVSLVL